MAIIGIILLLIAVVTILSVVLSGIVLSRMGYSRWAGLLFAFPFSASSRFGSWPFPNGRGK